MKDTRLELTQTYVYVDVLLYRLIHILTPVFGQETFCGSCSLRGILRDPPDPLCPTIQRRRVREAFSAVFRGLIRWLAINYKVTVKKITRLQRRN